jgi:hypothetical protein
MRDVHCTLVLPPTRSNTLNRGLFDACIGVIRLLELPPVLNLHAVREPVRSILKWNFAHEATEAVRPIGVCYERAQYGASEELPISSNLRCESTFAQPALVRSGKIRMIESTIARER